MASQDNDSALEISDFETQFVPQEDDDETLYRVIEITDEKANQYKVKWDGLNPKTKKPWAQSWVNKRDCTDDLVLEWKRRKAQKRASGAPLTVEVQYCSELSICSCEHANIWLVESLRIAFQGNRKPCRIRKTFAS